MVPHDGGAKDGRGPEGDAPEVGPGLCTSLTLNGVAGRSVMHMEQCVAGADLLAQGPDRLMGNGADGNSK
jgi:hypothetical protein